MVAQGQLPLLQRWLGEGKLRPSEQLADVLCDAERGGPAAALPMYREAGADEKARLCEGVWRFSFLLIGRGLSL